MVIRSYKQRGEGSQGAVGMEQEEHTGADDPSTTSLPRSEEQGMTAATRKKRRRKREPQMESIIVYRSEVEDRDEEGEAERRSEGGARDLSPPEDGGWSVPADSRFVTLTGTITRGRRKGQLVDIHVALSERELRDLARSKERLDAECEEAAAAGGSRRACALGPGRGPHVLLWSLSCSPLVFLLAFVAAFYYGTLTWYNVFLVYNEERTFLHKVTVCPCLVLAYPALIVALCACVGLYAAAAQLSWACGEWWRAARDLEKGACGWACGKLGLEDCAPYSVVELIDSDTLSGTLRARAAGGTEETSSV